MAERVVVRAMCRVKLIHLGSVADFMSNASFNEVLD